MKLTALSTLAVLAALLVVGCDGGSGSGSGPTMPGGDTTGGEGGATRGGGKKATAPSAPAGTKVVACGEGAAGIVQLRATAVGCDTARATMRYWERSDACALGRGASRGSCSLPGFRCQAVRVDRGGAVSCVRAGGDVSFVVKARPLKRAGTG